LKRPKCGESEKKRVHACGAREGKQSCDSACPKDRIKWEAVP